jgi:hypothetical protein
MCFGECVVLIFRVKRLLFGDIVSGGCLAKRLLSILPFAVTGNSGTLWTCDGMA